MLMGFINKVFYPVSVFGHLLQHLQQNENKILELTSLVIITETFCAILEII